MVKLVDLGERRILREIIPRFCAPAGDDCASVPIGGGDVIITTDPAPPPAARVLGGDSDLFWLGWLLVTINASDLAAAGAVPKAFVAALDLPNDIDTADFERLLSGIKASCEANALAYVGGNLRESDTVRGVGTAIGHCDYLPLRRAGAQVGDYVCVFGKIGNFWSDVFRVRAGREVDKMNSNLFAPVSQAGWIHQFAKRGLLNCGMDASDGFAPTLEELARVNEVRIIVNKSALEGGSDIYDTDLGIRACFGWGDWLVVSTMSAAQLDAAREFAASIDKEFLVCGRVENGEGVFVDHGTQISRLGKLESERFVSDSWFSAGIESYINKIKSFDIGADSDE